MSTSFFGFEAARCWDYENGFHLTSDPTRIAKMVAHYELYRRIVDLPGHVVECGVFKGASLIRFLTFREMLEGRGSRRVIGFDMFGAFPPQHEPDDAAFVAQFEASAGEGIPKAELERVLAHKGFGQVDLEAGDVAETIPAYLERHPELRIALLHLDMDTYAPTRAALDLLFDRVVEGGLVVLDDYGTVAGATRAVDEFLEGTGLRIEKLPLAHIPAFVVKSGRPVGPVVT